MRPILALFLALLLGGCNPSKSVALASKQFFSTQGVALMTVPEVKSNYLVYRLNYTEAKDIKQKLGLKNLDRDAEATNYYLLPLQDYFNNDGITAIRGGFSYTSDLLTIESIVMVELEDGNVFLAVKYQ